MSPFARRLTALILAAVFCQGGLCGGGGGGGGGGSAGGGGSPGVVAVQTCDGSCSQVALSVAQVQTIIAHAVGEAQLQGILATVAVVDHVGNVLAVFQMTGATTTTTITSNRGVTSGLEGTAVASTLAAISKAGTAAYLSTQGNAFTTRTASQIIQENFNPGENDKSGGPLFGVQFSQLPCGDMVVRFDAGDPTNRRGPKRMPLGFSADPGGLPLYIDGVPVGGIGVETGDDYSLDLVVTDFDSDLEERVAAAGTRGFEAPTDRRADRITVDGKFLRFADDETPAISSLPDFATLPGALTTVAGFYDATAGVGTGALFRDAASGIVATTFEGLDAEVLVDAAGNNRFPPRDAITAPGLLENEVRVLLREALTLAYDARAQIRRPLGSSARVTISVVDTGGEVLGIVRSADAPIFGTDVALQKARTAAFFSSTNAAADLTTAGLGSYVTAVRTFTGDGTALANGVAFSDRAGGNLSRPYYPDGINGSGNGPFSRPFADWSPFSTGLQLDVVLTALASVLAGGNPASCADAALSEIRSGTQIFPGSVPIFKGGVVVGGIGVSGDGVDQDDLISFLGLHNAGQILGTIGNAPAAVRADNISVGGINLRYVSCPPTPFLTSSQQNVCDGL